MKRVLAGALVVLVLLVSSTPSRAQGEGRWGARLAEGFQRLAASKLAEAQAIFDEVAAASALAHDDASRGEAIRGQGRVLAARGDSVGMQAAYLEALNLFESVGDLRGIGKVRSDLGYAAWRRSDFDGARAEYTRAAEAFAQGGFRTDEASALRNMTFGNMPLADKITTLERALAIAREGVDRGLEGEILHQLGDMLSGSGDQQGALEKYEAALPLLEAAGDGTTLARLLVSFGRLHRIHGDPELAVSFYQRALELLNRTGDGDAIRQTEDALSIALATLDRNPEALTHAERALTFAEASRPTEAPAQRVRVGEMALRAGDLDRALQLFGEASLRPALAVRRLIGRATAFHQRGDLEAAMVEADAAVAESRALDWEPIVRALAIRSYVHESAGRRRLAAADAVAAVRVIEEARGGLVVSDDFRAAFSEGYRYIYDRAVSMLSDNGDRQEAFEIAEKGRARALLDLRTVKGATPRTLEGTSSSIQAGITIAYWVTRHSTYAWLVDGGLVSASAKVPIERKELESLVAKANATTPFSPPSSSLPTRGQTQTVFESDPRPTLKTLHERLLAPLRKALPRTRGARLLIVPDGPLLGLSFAELIGGSGRYLIEDYTLQYAPSLALARRTRGAAPVVPGAPTLLVSLSAGYPKVGLAVLAPLPGARREVDALAPLFPGPNTMRMSEDEATEARVREAMGRQEIIHLATHAVASSRDPAQSFLALRPGGGFDGRLTAGEIIGMSLRAELVVLSACEGASGKVTGEGMLGLSRALLVAGAHTLLASVRALPDEAAAEMLPRFYADWKARGDGAAALRSAQLEQLARLRSGRVQVKTPFGAVTVPEHPSMWAGLILIGER